MDLYCIKTHSERAVIRGNVYPLISDKPRCNCKDSINVGVKVNLSDDNEPLNIGDLCECYHCGHIHRHDGYWWVSRTLFVNIDDINIEEAIECIKENELQTV